MSVRSPESGARRLLSRGAPATLGRGGDSLVLTEDDVVCASARDGDIEEGNASGHGLYHRDTRFLSVLTLRANGIAPTLLAAVPEPSFHARIDLTTPDLPGPDGGVSVPQQTLNIRRTRTLGRRLHERVRVKNHSAEPITVELQLTFAADFADVFEVRGLRRARRGTPLPPVADPEGVVFAYYGQDDLFRRTRVSLRSAADRVTVRGAVVTFTFDLSLRPNQSRLVGFAVEPGVGEVAGRFEDHDAALHRLRRDYEGWAASCTRFRCDDRRLDALLRHGVLDLRSLRMQTPAGRMLACGVPWYAAPIGRHALLGAYQSLSIAPSIAADTLRAFASLRGRRDDPWRDEEPGKMPHELRQGELALADVVPHSPYYGSADATPLFLMLAAAYVRWTDDRALVAELREAIDDALAWIDTSGDADGDGFVEYERRSPLGLVHQGWRDSADAVRHADGSDVTGPVALAEVQAYVYLAKLRLADVFDAIGDTAGGALRAQAAELRRRFNDVFWMPDEGYFAQALDGDKRQVRTISSSPAHGLYCGIIDRDKAGPVARRLLQPDMFSGWGVRTIPKGAPGYNPMSYHSGSVWPHDNAIIAAGLKRYGFLEATERVASALFEAADGGGMPEVLCGFTRRSPGRPVPYPVACQPHASAATAPFVLLQSMLGISARAHENLLTITAPSLPSWLATVEVSGLRIGTSTLSLVFRREGDVTSFSLLSKTGDVRVVMEE